jgi:ribosomal protein S27E
MNLTEKAAYLKGLAEGLSLSDQTAEGKLIKEIIALVQDVAKSVTDLEEGYEILANQVDDIDEDLANVEDEIYGEDEEEEDSCSCEECEGDGEEEFFDVTCPSCGEKIYLDEEMAEKDAVTCPSCGTELEIEFDEEDE